MKTLSISTEDADRRWVVIDAAGAPLGRLSARVAAMLRGKHKPTFTPHADTGDFVVVINAAGIELSGRKWKDKMVRHHTGYFGGLKEISAERLHEKDPTALVSNAVKGMLPRGPLGRKIYRKLKVYAGSDHPHTAQQPELVEL